nr:homeobox protein BEL1 homolog [Ipomoea batatas]
MAGEEGEGKGRSSSMVTNTGYWYSDAAINTQIQSGHMASQLQGFEPNPEIYNLSSGMEMMGGFPIKNLQAQSDMWKQAAGFGGGGGGGSGPVPLSHTGNMVVGGGGNNNEMKVSITQKGLSLSLSSTNPSAIGFHSFDDLRLVAASSSSSRLNNNTCIQHDDGFLGKPENLGHPSQDLFFQIRTSKYLGPAQELLKEFCCVETTSQSDEPKRKQPQMSSQWQQDAAASSENHSLGSLHFLELQKTKSKLLHLLDEVDRRYKHYRDQMTAVVSSFEAVAGDGAATVYSALASRVMSRHFRGLRDAILAQLKAVKKAMSEKESSAAPGATKGETPRLKMIDQTLRQQKAIQQLTMMDSHPWRPQRGLPERSVSVLRAWLFEHFLHPYPSDVDKHILARQTGLSRSQVSNWFINARVRLWKPMVEEMYLEEVKEQDNNILGSSEGARAAAVDGRERLDKKPNIVRLDSECISSLINIPAKGGDHHQFGAVELDFSPYTAAGAVGYRPGERKTGGGVSLTLGLQQHGGSGGIGLGFSPASHQNSLFYPRDQIGDCPPVQYSLLDGEAQNLPYRNLMGSQLLHDLAG